MTPHSLSFIHSFISLIHSCNYDNDDVNRSENGNSESSNNFSMGKITFISINDHQSPFNLRFCTQIT